MNGKPLVGDCHSCFKPKSTYHPRLDQYLCAKHAIQVLNWDASLDHLQELIDYPVEVWVRHWLERGLSVEDLCSTFDRLTPYLKDIVTDGLATARTRANPQDESA